MTDELIKEKIIEFRQRMVQMIKWFDSAPYYSFYKKKWLKLKKRFKRKKRLFTKK